MSFCVRFDMHLPLKYPTNLNILGFYPRLILLLPQLAFIGIILATYPYHPTSSSSSDPLFFTGDSAFSSIPPIEGSVPWQANIQGIQNLMGATYVAVTLLLFYPFVKAFI